MRLGRSHVLPALIALAFTIPTVPRDGPLPIATPTPTAPGVPMFRGDPAHSGVHPGPGPEGTPREVWRVALPGQSFFSSPVVVDGTVYIGGGTGDPADQTPGFVVAIDTATGAERWRVRTASAVIATPAVAEGVVYVPGGPDGVPTSILYALDAATGAERWRFAAEGGLTSSPTVADGTVYIGGEAILSPGPAPDHQTGFVYAIDAATGTERWRQRVGDEAESSVDAVKSTPAIAANLAIFGIDHSGIYALDTATGAERWRFRPGSGFISSPAVVDGIVYAGGRDGVLYAVAAATGRERWRAPLGDTSASSPAVAGGVVYVGSETQGTDGAPAAGFLHALDGATGRESWRLRLGASVFSSPAIVGDVIYIGSLNPPTAEAESGSGALHAVEAVAGRELWRFATGPIASSPAVVGGVVYVATVDGLLLAIGGTAAPAMPPWQVVMPVVRRRAVFPAARETLPERAAGAATDTRG